MTTIHVTEGYPEGGHDEPLHYAKEAVANCRRVSGAPELDELAAGIVASSERLRRWAGAAKVVADRRTAGVTDDAH